MMFSFSRESPSFVNFCNYVSSANRLICIFFYRLTSFASIIRCFAIFFNMLKEFLGILYNYISLTLSILLTSLPTFAFKRTCNGSQLMEYQCIEYVFSVFVSLPVTLSSGLK